MNSAALKAGLLSVLGLAFSSVAGLAGCGGLWEVPKDHFDGVNEFGHVSYWDKIADIDIGEDKPFPVVIGFQSDRETSSPYLGYGWVMPLLESYMVQTGESTFQIMKPTGYTSGFGRDPKNASAIGGVQGWKGEIGSDTIKVWAPCGWSLSYTRGKLAEIGTPKGKQIVIKRDMAGQVEDLTMDGKVLIKVLKGFGGRTEGLEVEGKKLGINLGEKPRVQSLQGKNLIAGKDLSLEKIGIPGNELIYQYGLSDTLQPTLTVKGEAAPNREIIWNAEGGKIERDGNWKYDIRSPLKMGENAAIGRVDDKGKRELWHYDRVKGEEVTENIDGTKIVKSWFTSGPIAGKIRGILESSADQGGNREAKILYRASYDENAKLIREEIGDLVIDFLETGNELVKTARDQKGILWIKHFQNGKLVRSEIPGTLIAEIDNSSTPVKKIVSFNK